MKRLILAPNVPARNDLPIAFKATKETKDVLMELARLFGDVIGQVDPLNTSATIRTCIHFAYVHRRKIHAAIIRERQLREKQQCRSLPTDPTATTAIPEQSRPELHSQPLPNGTTEPQACEPR